MCCKIEQKLEQRVKTMSQTCLQGVEVAAEKIATTSLKGAAGRWGWTLLSAIAQQMAWDWDTELWLLKASQHL